jgi:fructose-bisphosphate aldolase class I
MDDLRRRTRGLFAFRRGILALDTAPACLTARFRLASIKPSARAVDRYLAMVLSTPDLAEATSGVVLHAAAFDRLTARGRELSERLREAGILLGVRADAGSEPLSADGRELVTTGLDGLAARLSGMARRGASFAVWSAVTSTDPDALRVVTANSQAAARFGYVCQDAGLVPVIRVGTRLTGGSAALADGLFCPRSAAVAAALLSVCGHLEDFGADLGAVVISTDPGTAGNASPGGHRLAGHIPEPRAGGLPLGGGGFGGFPEPRAGGLPLGGGGFGGFPEPLAAGPLAALPGSIGGVALTGGWPSPSAAAAAVARVCLAEPPWPVTFYLGRQLTQPALAAWGGRSSSILAGQRALRAGLVTASAALPGDHSPIPAEV